MYVYIKVGRLALSARPSVCLFVRPAALSLCVSRALESILDRELGELDVERDRDRRED